MDHQLLVLKGRSVVKTVRLADGVTTVGRQDGCELTVRSSQVSRKHCQLFEKKGMLLVKDLGSANGTFVNDKRIEEQRVLEPGDVLTVGPIQFRVEKLTAQAAAAASADISSDSDTKPKPTDTAVAEAVEAPIPLDEDDVLEFVTGVEVEPAPPPKPAKPDKPAASPRKEPAPAAAPAAKAAAKPKPKAEAAPSQETAEAGGADEAVAEFLMGIEIDDEDRR